MRSSSPSSVAVTPPLDAARPRVRALQNARAMYLMRAPTRPTRARSFVPLRVERRRLETRRAALRTRRWEDKISKSTSHDSRRNIENTTGFRIRVLKQGDDGRIWFKTRVTTRASERVEDDDARHRDDVVGGHTRACESDARAPLALVVAVPEGGVVRESSVGRRERLRVPRAATIVRGVERGAVRRRVRRCERAREA